MLHRGWVKYGSLLIVGGALAVVFLFVYQLRDFEHDAGGNESGVQALGEVAGAATEIEVEQSEEDGPMVFLTSLERYLPLYELQAREVYVEYQNEEGEIIPIYAHGQEAEPRPFASLTKIMTAVVAWDNRNKIESVAIGPDAIAQEGDQGLLRGMEWPTEEAIYMMMQSSSNDMAYAIQESISEALRPNLLGRGAVVNQFVQVMNKRAEQVGMSNTFYVDAIGFDESERLSGSYGSPADVARLVWHVLDAYPSIAEKSVASGSEVTVGGNVVKATNTNPLLATHPEIIFSKTGFTDLAGGNLAFASEHSQGRFVFVIMGSGFEGRYSDAEILLGAVAQWSDYNLE